jgi:hypothetical protein
LSVSLDFISAVAKTKRNRQTPTKALYLDIEDCTNLFFGSLALMGVPNHELATKLFAELAKNRGRSLEELTGQNKDTRRK